MSGHASPRRPGRLAAGEAKQPLNLRLDAELIRRMKRHALDRGKTVSDFVAELATREMEEGDATP